MGCTTTENDHQDDDFVYNSRNRRERTPNREEDNEDNEKFKDFEEIGSN